MYKLELSENEVNLILQSLGEQKASVTMNIILNIKTQCAKQVKSKEESKEKPKK